MFYWWCLCCLWCLLRIDGWLVLGFWFVCCMVLGCVLIWYAGLGFVLLLVLDLLVIMLDVLIDCCLLCWCFVLNGWMFIWVVWWLLGVLLGGGFCFVALLLLVVCFWFVFGFCLFWLCLFACGVAFCGKCLLC